MRNTKNSRVMTFILVWTLLLPTLAFGQQAAKADAAKVSAVKNSTSTFADYLIKVSTKYATSQEFSLMLFEH